MKTLNCHQIVFDSLNHRLCSAEMSGWSSNLCSTVVIRLGMSQPKTLSMSWLFVVAVDRWIELERWLVSLFQPSMMASWLVAGVLRALCPNFAFHVYGVLRSSVLSAQMFHPAT
jgi:hypothetical protein